MFEYAFEGLKSTFNTQKVFKEKSTLSVKKTKGASKGLKCLKMTETHFWQKLHL